ncbi:MAG: lysostaphin resistance A-like protein [Bacilli bacterium]
MEQPITKKFNDANFYLLAFFGSFILFNILPLVFLVVASLAVEFQQPGFFASFLNDYLGSGDLVFTPTVIGILNISQMLGEILLLGIFVVILWKHFIRDGKLFFSKANFGKYIGIILVGFIAINVAIVGLAEIFELLKIEGTSENQSIVESMLSYDSKIFMIITTILLAPIVEEIIFRKLLFGVVEEKFHLPPIFAILISAVIFAAIHAVDAFFFQYLALALIIAGSYAYSKNNIFVPIGIHLINNALSVILYFLSEGLF